MKRLTTYTNTIFNETAHDFQYISKSVKYSTYIASSNLELSFEVFKGNNVTFMYHALYVLPGDKISMHAKSVNNCLFSSGSVCFVFKKCHRMSWNTFTICLIIGVPHHIVCMCSHVFRLDCDNLSC